ncbi:hypothetical protein F1188_03930 [Roseospira marina]|uniref:Flavoprotein domain-containing protein n=1 Tax=Roseospira marina TaxID=140057 RepID=A0A5M6IFP8_9PROT|nr:flavoprotein [Roseospira marina]KAA5607063.1 hypothetical protein F1188_03930 [Roseospira marina]MBB4312746.1 hypothetical protein [Roseospira marina]MBB5086481.1 hypothetical protein [Roseospira marina]
MSAQDLDRLVEQALIDHLVDDLSTQVVERLVTRRRTALTLLTGTDVGLGKAVGGLRDLREAGWRLRYVLSGEARDLLTPDRLADLNAEMLAAAVAEAGVPGDLDIDAMLTNCALVMVPALSITTAAKVAACIRDSLPSRLLARALERGVRVIAASDGCCPDVRERAARSFHVTEAYKARMRANIATLKDFGVEIVRARDLGRAVLGPAQTAATLASAGAPVVAPLTAPVPRAVEPVWTGKRIFSRGDAVQWTGSELRLDRGVLVTPAAADELRARNVRVIQG